MPDMMRVARQRNFALLWLAGLASLIGDWAFYTVVPVFVLDEADSVLLAGVVWAVIALPSLVVAPFAGVWVDRWNRQQIMLWGNIAQAAVGAILVIAGDAAGYWLVMSVVLATASIATIILPAENALLPTVVADEDLAPANALNAMNDNLARIVGPPIGALGYTQFGIGGVALIDVGSFLIAAGLVLAVGRQSPRGFECAETADAREPFWASLRAGASVVRSKRLLGALFMVFGLVAFADGPIAAMIAPFIDTSLDKGASGVGVFATVRGVAGIYGALLIAQLAKRVREDRLLVACILVDGIGFAAIALSGNFLIACLILLVVIGPSHIGVHTTMMTLLQRGTEDSHRGRVLALVHSLTGGLFLVGSVGGSVAGDAFSPVAVLVGSGALFLITGFATWKRLTPAYALAR
jgi:MFS family permease